MNIAFKQCHLSNFIIGRASKIKRIVIHYTANNGDTAKNNAFYFQGTPNLKASAHYFVDEFEVWQSVKDEDTAQHVSGGNSDSIGIEICSRKDTSGRYYLHVDAVNNAIKLTQLLMAKYGLSIKDVVRHYDVTGKNCPEPFVRDVLQWNNFKSRCDNSMIVSAINTLVDKKVIGSPDYWVNNYNKLPNVDTLLIKMASYDKQKINNIKDALDKMVEKGIINSPDYWMSNYNKLQYLEALIINYANSL